MKRIVLSMICVVLFTGISIAGAAGQTTTVAPVATTTAPAEQATTVAPVDPTTVVARVNNETILQSDVENVFNLFVLPQFKAQNPDKEFPTDQKLKVEQGITSQLATQKLLIQAAAKLGVKPDETIVNTQFDTLKAQYPQASPEFLKDFLIREVTIQALLQQEVISKITVSDEEVKKYYDERKDQFNEPEQVRASHVLVQVDPKATQETKDAAKKKIEDVLAQAQAGKDFAELAKQYSDCPSKEQGGDLGFFKRGDMVKPFEDAAFALNVGELSGVVETQFGFHVIQLAEKKSAREVPFEEAKERLTQSIKQQRTNTDAVAWVNALKSKSTIELLNQPPAEPTQPAEPQPTTKP